MTKPIVAIIGRQNVGKSTLLNRLAGRQVSIVADVPGTTRDRIFADVTWQDVTFTLVDTGGLDMAPQSSIARGIKSQVEAAVSEADVIIFLADLKDGVLPADLEIADMLRSNTKPVLLVVNKADNPALENQAADFYRLGLGEPQVISAYHGRGTAELLDTLITRLPAKRSEDTAVRGMKLAIVGRPNVGKSTLLNALLGEERVIVDAVPGTTHDAVNTPIDFLGQNVILIDTAGIRRRGRWGGGVELYSIVRALRAIDEADVALLVLDATELLAAQDKHVAGYVRDANKGVVLVVNKWDLIEGKDKEECNQYIREQLKFLSYAPVVFISAKLGTGVDRVMPQAFQVYQERLKRIPASAVEDTIRKAVEGHNLPRKGIQQLKIYGASQTEVNPPTFVFSVNDGRLMHFSYQRYLENQLRQAFGFEGTPIRLIFSPRGEK
jgi:GTPase